MFRAIVIHHMLYIFQVKIVIQILKHWFKIQQKTKPSLLPDDFIKVLGTLKIKFHDLQQDAILKALKSKKSGKRKT